MWLILACKLKLNCHDVIKQLSKLYIIAEHSFMFPLVKGI